MNDPTPAPREPVRLAEVGADYPLMTPDRLARLAAKRGRLRPPPARIKWPDPNDPAALRQPTYTEPGGPE